MKGASAAAQHSTHQVGTRDGADIDGAKGGDVKHLGSTGLQLEAQGSGLAPADAVGEQHHDVDCAAAIIALVLNVAREDGGACSEGGRNRESGERCKKFPQSQCKGRSHTGLQGDKAT